MEEKKRVYELLIKPNNRASFTLHPLSFLFCAFLDLKACVHSRVFNIAFFFLSADKAKLELESYHASAMTSI